MNATRRTHLTRTPTARLLAGAALAVIFSIAIDAGPAYADPGQRHSGRGYDQDDRDGDWGYRDDRRDNERQGGRRDYGRDDRDWRDGDRGHQGRHAGRHLGWRNHQYAHRQHAYSARRWHTNSYSGWGQSGYGHSGYGRPGGASIILNFPIR